MASKTDSSKKNRRRKPLVQGRLVLEEPKIHNANDDAQDPTISPRKSVPKLTEGIFPQAEQPSKYLDLSDEEGEKEADLPQPVLVCDASHLAVSPDGTEVDVIIGFEPSPVKVFRHTPGKMVQDVQKSAGIKSHREPESKTTKELVSEADSNASNESLMAQQTKQKKSKSYRVVQSRYMQPSLNKTQNYLSKTFVGSRDSSDHQRSSGNQPKPEKQISMSGSSARKQKASTPTLEEKSLFLEDISTIQSTSIMSCHAAESKVPLKRVDTKKPIPKISKDQSAKPGEKADKESDALKVHFAYTRYLQYAFLNLKAGKAIKDRDEAATSELSRLWHVMESQREELSKTESDVGNLRRLLLAEEVLGKTEPELNAAASSLPEDYSTLSGAIGNTLYQLPVKDIVVPQSESEREKFEKNMQDALCESGSVLSEIKEIVNGEVDQMGLFAKNLSSLDEYYTETSTELHSVEKELVQVQDLTTEMTSLVVQNIQDSEQN